jgi:hypothetical protein
MKKDTGFVALAAFALAFFGVSTFPWGGSGAAPGSEENGEKKTNRTNVSQKAAPHIDACSEIARRIELFLKPSETKEWKLPDSCYESPDKAKALPQRAADSDLHFLIATVPNPVTTHLPLMFDRFIEAIQRAARDEAYAYDSSWFPWDEAKQYSSLTDERAAAQAMEQQQTQPGVITFRKSTLKANEPTYGNGLIVFVVSEQPTQGIDDSEFENALAWMEAIGGLDVKHGLKILGPAFSGSLPSVRRAFLSSKRLAQFDGNGATHIYSGSVSSQASYEWFKNFVETSTLGTFRTAMEGDSRMIQLFCSYIKSQGYDMDRVAFLSEDETAFGMTTDTDPCHDGESGKDPIHLSYPRDIASLRSAYQKQSILGPGKPQGGGNAASTSLRGDLTEPSTGEHDTVRSYGGQLTPLAQESSLVAITNILNSKNIQFVILRSTNTLDQIFLGQFVKRVYPEARLVMDGTDLLFRRGGEGASLRGVLLLSSYPLLTWQHDWTPPMETDQSQTYSVFGEDVVEGEYIAARELLGPSSQAIITDYAPPLWALGSTPLEKQKPATWISVIGHHQFWPVAVLDENTIEPKTGIPTEKVNQTASLPEAMPVYLSKTSQKFQLGIGGGLQFLMVVGVIWGALHVLWCRNGSITPSAGLFKLAYFAPLQRKQHAGLIALGSLLPAFAAVVAAFGTGLMTWSLDLTGRSIEIACVAGLLFAAVYACWANYGMETVGAAPRPENRGHRDWLRKTAAAAVICFTIFVGLYCYFLYFSGSVTAANEIPAYWRSAHLLSGTSALLPQMLLLAGLYLWFWFALRGLALFGDDRPLLPNRDDLLVADVVIKDGTKRISMMPMFSRECAGNSIDGAAIPLAKEHCRTLVATIVAAFFVFLLALENTEIRTLGERAFGRMMFFWVVLYMGMVLGDSVQLWVTWKRLHQLLTYMDRLRLRRTLACLKGLSWGSVWSVSGNTLGERYRLISRQFESLGHLRNQLAKWVPDQTTPDKPSEALTRKLTAVNQVEDCQSRGKAFAEWFVQLGKDPVTNLLPMNAFQNDLAKTAGVILEKILLPAWHTETTSLVIRKEAGKPKEGESGNPVSFETEGIAPHVLAAEEFFVLPYLGFIQNILGRIRTIVLGSLVLFVATTLAMASYPFDPLPRLGGAFLVVFVIAGGVVIVVYAQMNRDATLSYITNTNPGELGSQFWVQLITFGIGPLLGLLTTLFPSITDFVTGWLQPNVQALK